MKHTKLVTNICYNESCFVTKQFVLTIVGNGFQNVTTLEAGGECATLESYK